MTDEKNDRLIEKMGQPGPAEEAFFARRRKLGLGVGLDAAGNLVRQEVHDEAILPVEAFEAFKAAVEAPGKKIPGLARAAKATKGSLKDAGGS